MREGALLARVLALAAVASIALALPASASGDSTTTEPTLTLEKTCGEQPGVRITLTGFPPNTPYTATIVFPGGQAGPGQATSGPNGEFFLSSLGAGTGTYTVTIVWSGGTIQESISVVCTITKDDCRNGGWRQFRSFKSQGQCVAFVERGPKGEPVIVLDADCRQGAPYGGTLDVSGLEPNTEYALVYLQVGGGGHWFTTNAVGAGVAIGGVVSSEPFEVGVRIWRDLNHDLAVNNGEVVAIEAHFTVDEPCEDVFPDSS